MEMDGMGRGGVLVGFILTFGYWNRSVRISSEQVQMVRLMLRESSTSEAASSRLKSQLPITQKLSYADYVVDNSGSLKDVEGQIVTLVKRLERQVGWFWWRMEWLVPPVGLLSAAWTLIWRMVRRRRRESE